MIQVNLSIEQSKFLSRRQSFPFSFSFFLFSCFSLVFPLKNMLNRKRLPFLHSTPFTQSTTTTTGPSTTWGNEQPSAQANRSARGTFSEYVLDPHKHRHMKQSMHSDMMPPSVAAQDAFLRGGDWSLKARRYQQQQQQQQPHASENGLGPVGAEHGLFPLRCNCYFLFIISIQLQFHLCVPR